MKKRSLGTLFSPKLRLTTTKQQSFQFIDETRNPKKITTVSFMALNLRSEMKFESLIEGGVSLDLCWSLEKSKFRGHAGSGRFAVV